ncbi:APC family permease [Vulcanisaeta thermophila]|uniref:APC family permease n=1 Tax=Vulcanisaeta thermophila TaxID=867917 RepID=UPI0008539487|nr:APC family permease [Vulcanisaeta thermophila]
MGGEYGVFVRESTGLVKEAGFWDAVSINIANMSVGAALASIGFTLAVLPTVTGSNLVLASLIAALFAVPQVIVYSILTTHIPRVGGDYVWLGRALGPRLAWLTNGLVLGFIVESLTYYALIAYSAVGQLESVLPILGVGASLNTYEEIVIASAFFGIIVLVNILGTRYGIRLMTVLTTLSMIGLLMAMVVLFATPRSVAISSISTLLPKGVTYQAVASGYKGPYFTMNEALMLLPFFAIYVYPWLNAGPAIASEIKGRSAVKWNVPLSFLITLALLTLGFEAMYHSLGFEFTTMALANGYINFWTAAMVLSRNPVIAWFLGVASILWYLAILAYGAIVVVRYWFALAFDRVWPSFFAYLSPRFGTPIYAHITDFLITAALITAAGLLYNTFTALYGAVVEALLYYMFVGIGAAVMGLLKYGSFNMGGGIRASLTISGVLMAIVMAYLTYEFLAYPSIWGGNWLAYGVELAAVALGMIIYLVSRYINVRKYGFDISIAYSEIPPE